MILTIRCPNCHHDILTKGFMVASRNDLAKSKGTEFKVKCNKCASSHMAHVDDVMASVNGWKLILAAVGCVMLACVAIVFVWNKGYIAYATVGGPLVIYYGIDKNERNNVKQFNMIYYDHKRHIEKHDLN